MKWILLFFLLNFFDCNEPIRTAMELNQEHKVIITDCGVSYNDEPLDFGVPLEEWIEILGPYRKGELGYVWDDLGIAATMRRDSSANSGKKFILVTNKLYLFFQNLQDPHPMEFKLHYPYPETSIYPHSPFRDAVELNGALIGRGMGISELQNRLDEGRTSGKLKYLPDYKRGEDPYEGYGFGGRYALPAKTFCEGRRYSFNIYNAPFKQVEDAPSNSQKPGWQFGIEILQVDEFDANSYLYHGKKKLLESIETNDVILKQEAKLILQRAIEKGSKEAKQFWNENDLDNK